MWRKLSISESSQEKFDVVERLIHVQANSFSKGRILTFPAQALVPPPPEMAKRREALKTGCRLGSAQTRARDTQLFMESKLESKRKTRLGAPANRRVVFFVDDINMPAQEKYGAQPPIELLRQLVDYKVSHISFVYVAGVHYSIGSTTLYSMTVHLSTSHAGVQNPTSLKIFRNIHLLLLHFILVFLFSCFMRNSLEQHGFPSHKHGRSNNLFSTYLYREVKLQCVDRVSREYPHTAQEAGLPDMVCSVQLIRAAEAVLRHADMPGLRQWSLELLQDSRCAKAVCWPPRAACCS